MILPTSKLLILLLLPAPVLVLFPHQAAAYAVAGYDAAVLLLAAAGVLISARPRQIAVQRALPEHLSLGAVNQVGWNIRNLAALPLAFELTEDVPESMQRETPKMTGTIPPHASADLFYGVLPTRRGLYEFGDIFVRWQTQLGLVIRQKRIRARDP